MVALKKILLFFFVASLFACDNNSDGLEPSSTKYQIPNLVSLYVDKFLKEAEVRGVRIVLDNLIIELTNEVQSGTSRVCASTWGPVIDIEQNLIRIDTTCISWTQGGTEREILVIHELGHALLERFHKEGRFPSGDWRSLMTSEWNIGDFYAQDSEKESYYFDELFDESTPIPLWAE